jgi:hypothetical protein
VFFSASLIREPRPLQPVCSLESTRWLHYPPVPQN